MDKETFKKLTQQLLKSGKNIIVMVNGKQKAIVGQECWDKLLPIFEGLASNPEFSNSINNNFSNCEIFHQNESVVIKFINSNENPISNGVQVLSFKLLPILMS